MTEQITLDGYLTNELICCSMTRHYHWIRISEGRTPEGYADRIHFTLRGYDYLYEPTEGKDEIINAFCGDVKYRDWESEVV